MFRADCAKNVCGFGPLVLRSRWPSSTPGPTPGDLVLLAAPRFVLEPYLYGRALREGCSGLCQLPSEAPFFEGIHGKFVLGMVARPRRELDVAQLQLAPYGCFVERYRELLVQPLDQVDHPPANNPVDCRDRTALDSLDQCTPSGIIEPGARAGVLPSSGPSGPRALNRTTQSRTICKPTPPIRAAVVRLPPS